MLGKVTKFSDHLRQNCLEDTAASAFHHQKSVKMSRDEFEEFFLAARPHYSRFTQKEFVRDPRRTYKEGVIPDKAQLWYTLFWLRQYPTYGAMASILNIHEKRVGDMLKRNIAVLVATFKQQGKLNKPSEEEFLSKLAQSRAAIDHADLKDMVAVLDGTEPQIPRPADPEKERTTYSGKKKHHSRNVLILVWILTGLIIWISPTFRGAHDQRDFNRTNIRDWFVGKDYGLLADGGFTLNRVSDSVKIKGLVPRKRPKKGKLTDADKIYNKNISQYRVVVENSIGKLKSWRVLKGIFRQQKESEHMKIHIDDVIYVCAVLANREIEKIPLRKPGWKPTTGDNSADNSQSSVTSPR